MRGMTGAVLAGGRSSRMGSDKSRLVLPGGSTMLERALRTLYKALGSDLLISGPGGLKDLWPNRGPMGGIGTVLQRVPLGSVLFIPCDMPFIEPELIRKMAAVHLAFPERPAVAVSGCIEPLLAVVPVTWKTRVTNALEAGHLKVGRFFMDLGFTEVPAGDRAALTDIDLPGDMTA